MSKAEIILHKVAQGNGLYFILRNMMQDGGGDVGDAEDFLWRTAGGCAGGLKPMAIPSKTFGHVTLRRPHDQGVCRAVNALSGGPGRVGRDGSDQK